MAREDTQCKKEYEQMIIVSINLGFFFLPSLLLNRRGFCKLEEILTLLILSFFSGEAEKELLFPCMSEVKSKLRSDYDRDEISLVENLFEQKDFQDATKVSV